MIRSACFLSITCLLLFATIGLAQTQNAQLNGTITDPASAVAPLASVTVTHLGTGVSRTILSNDTGNYVFTNLLPGVYTIAVSKEGFRKAVCHNRFVRPSRARHGTGGTAKRCRGSVFTRMPFGRVGAGQEAKCNGIMV